MTSTSTVTHADLKARLLSASNAILEMIWAGRDIVNLLLHEPTNCNLVEWTIHNSLDKRNLAADALFGKLGQAESEKECCRQLQSLLGAVAQQTEIFGFTGLSAADIAITVCTFLHLGMRNTIRHGLAGHISPLHCQKLRKLFQKKPFPQKTLAGLGKGKPSLHSWSAFTKLELAVAQELSRAELRLREIEALTCVRPVEVCELSDAAVPSASNGKREAKRKRSSTSDMSNSDRWLTVSAAAMVSGLTQAEISRLASNGRIKSNGKQRRKRRIDGVSLNQYQLDQVRRKESAESLELKLPKAQMSPK